MGHRNLRVTEKSFLVVSDTLKLVDFNYAKKHDASDSAVGFLSKSETIDLALLAIFLTTGKSYFPQSSRSYTEHH